MSEANAPAGTDAAPPATKPPGRLIGILGMLLGAFALAAPMLPGRLAFPVLGLLILAVGLLQNITGFGLTNAARSGAWFSRGGSSVITGLLLMIMPKLTFAGLAILLGLSWSLSGIAAIAAAARDRSEVDWIWRLIDGVVNVVLGLAIMLQWPVEGIVSVGVFVGLRYLSAGWSALVGAPSIQAPASSEEALGLHPDERLGLASHPYFASLRERLISEEQVRLRSDRGWRWLFLITLFFIHAARMDTDWNVVGLLSPAGAVIGDAALAIVLAYALVAPVAVSWRNLTRGVERRAWHRYLAALDSGAVPGLRSRLVQGWLTGRLRAAWRRQHTQGSPTAALGWGLQTGLPLAAILAAVTPLWGVSWFFNTETWVTGAWEMWAERRTDTWRAAMVQAIEKEYGDAAATSNLLRVTPEGVAGAKDFSFIVIGDTGEGDASQHILRDQLLLLGQKPEVKFLVVSSDVIYPSGAMKDYEPKFYLPFKGFHKPIYALPGNHDWYDALESFTANFLEPKAARAALRARLEVDLHLTTTTETRADQMIQSAERLRREYQIRAALQRSPYFEVHAEAFSLVVADTGIQRRLDDAQFQWLDKALARAGSNFKMVLLGHPIYVAGRYQGTDDEDFARVHHLLQEHAVQVVMAGDTHDFEYYKELYEQDGHAKDVRGTAGQERSMYHFVNGGGGAYLSIGTALDWPNEPPVGECGFYPRADALIASLDANTPLWKRPLWTWVKRFKAWPSSPELVASAFDYDHAPFFQSFMEVRVEGSANRVRFRLYGANGRLRWRDLHVHGDRIPSGQAADEPVEFAFPLRDSAARREDDDQ
ncbi:MAG: metallophosphoesterase [Gemmataceae bacterium]|nr:metallophosphoesterase [Gemmataceae bacterium]